MAALSTELEQGIEKARQALKNAQRVAVLTGAGVSAESGVPTFRASDGLWEGHPIEDVATPNGFRRDPKLVWNFYHQRRANVRTVKPNPGHEALVKMEQHWGENFTLITQNVDGLHAVAGSRRLLELHGSLYRTRCTGCSEIVVQTLEPLDELPHCLSCGRMLRPDIVWFQEALPESIWEESLYAAASCQVFLSIGTSAVVHPAAGLISIAKRGGWTSQQAPATVIEINLTRTEASDLADIGLYGKAGEILPRILPG